MKNLNSTRGLLALIAVLLAANLAVILFKPSTSTNVASIIPSAQAGDVIKMESGEIVITTNQEGDKLTVWRFGRFVGDGYETISSRSYYAGK